MSRRHADHALRVNLLVTALLLSAAAAGSAASADPAAPSKRSEGHYFVELSEIMLTTRDFDVAVATVDPGGPGFGPGPSEAVAELSKWNAEAPRVTIGLNRPNGKTQISLSVFDFDLVSQKVPQSFEDQTNVTTSHFLPPGWVFQYHADSPGFGDPSSDDDYVPNWGTEFAFIRRVDFRQADLTYAHNLYENKRLRLRWLGGLRYAQLEQKFSHAMAHAKEFFPAVVFGGEVVLRQLEFQDFLFVQSEVSTQGLGPKTGLAFKLWPDKSQRWSIEATADIALIPEATNARYGINAVDGATRVSPTSRDCDGDGFTDRVISSGNERPIIPGLVFTNLVANPDDPEEFAAEARQSDFRESTYLATGQIGFRFKPKPFFTIGLDLWTMRWMNVLSQTGVVDTVHREATYEYYYGDLCSTDPQLQSGQGVVHVPRFDQRETFAFEGISLNLGFEF